MSMLHTIQNTYVAGRTAEVTADDTLIDGTSMMTTDFTSRDVLELGEDVNGVQVTFIAECATATPDTFACNIWGAAKAGFGQAKDATATSHPTCPEFICDITGAGRDGYYTDTTVRLFLNDISVINQRHGKTVTVQPGDLTLTPSPSKVLFDTVGYDWLYFEFYTVGTGASNEVDRIMPYVRGF